MEKTVRLFATLRDIAGQKEITVPFEDGQTVRQFLATVTDIMPELGHEILDETGELTGLVHVMVHGRNIHWLDGLDTTIKASDQLVLMPPSAGG
ncbi:MAG: ubiquitin-like small modifier protein 1 [Chloroflexota bacterium]